MNVDKPYFYSLFHFINESN